MTVVINRKDVKYVAELPQVSGKEPWHLTTLHGRIIAAHPDHVPIILGLDNTWEKIEFTERVAQ